MKKTVFLAAAAVALASCSSDELVNNSAVNEAPIAFNVGQKSLVQNHRNSRIQVTTTLVCGLTKLELLEIQPASWLWRTIL